MENPLKDINPKQKKVLIGVGVLAAGYVTYRWMTADSSDEPITVTSDVDPELVGTGIIGSNVGGSENVGNSDNLDTTDQISSNDKWFAAAVERLSLGGWDQQAVQSALGDFLTGQSLTTSEAQIVRAAVGAMGGYPPQGPTSIKEMPGTPDSASLTAPKGLKVAKKSSNSVDLEWLPVNGAKTYRVYRSGVAQNVGASNDTKAQIGGLQPGGKYTFYVAAGTDDSKMGPRSSGLSVTLDAQKLVAPKGLKVTNIGKTSARLTWTPTYPNEYVYRRSGSSQIWESVDAATNLTGLKSKTKYSYQVAAVKPGTRTPGPWSSYVTFTTKR